MNYKVSNRIQGARNKQSGKGGEDIAERALINMGLKCITKIATPCIFNPVQKKMVPVGKVPGDFHAVGPNGVAVLVETKTFDGDRLRYSKIEKHQHEDLHAHKQAGGIAYLVWVHQRIAHVLEWPVIGFKSGTSLSIEQARKLCVLNLAKEILKAVK